MTECKSSGWRHECSLDWLRARQCFLTASDIHALLPFTPTGKRRKVDDSAYVKLLASKWKRLEYEDTVSVGAAARGHMLEADAVDAMNSLGKSFYHWDDLLVCRRGSYLAYSPDAMDAPMPDSVPEMKFHLPCWSEDKVLTSCAVDYDSFDHSTLLEIKCYSPERHLTTMHEERGKLEERWQIATAMAVDEMIDEAWLLLHNPDMARYSDGLFQWWRSDLDFEISTVLEISEIWRNLVNSGLGWMTRDSTVFDYHRDERYSTVFDYHRSER